ncbi:MAG TPA: cation transporter [Terriglobales bacterium]|nr:cation transporter [Terriglobales bacterium]
MHFFLATMAVPSQPPNPITQSPDHSITQLAAARRGRRVEYLTVAWNSAEGIAALIAGFLAGSIALVGFGLDSVIEISSGVVLLWRLRAEGDAERREHAEHRAQRLVGICFLSLAAYVAYDSVKGLVRHEAPGESIFGIAVAIAALIAMPLLARAKRQVARQLNSGAMHADSRQSDFCAYLSAILLAGLLLNALLGWWWADPVAALVMVPLIAREGVEGLRAKRCCD